MINAEAEDVTPSGAVNGSLSRSLVSLALLIHLFFVFTALAANLAPSPLLARILERFAFYSQLLNIDARFTPYYLTHAQESDVDHLVEITTRGGETLRFPERGFAGGEHYQRQQRLARALAELAEDETRAGLLASAVAEHARHQYAVAPQRIRARRHMLQHWEAVRGGGTAERDPNSELYFRTPYEANCVLLDDGRVRVVRVEDVGQVALPPAQGGDREERE